MRRASTPLPLPRRSRPRALAPPTPGSAADARRADRSIIILGVVVLLVAAGLLLWAIADVILLVFAGALMGLFLHGLSEYVQQRLGLSELKSLAVVLVVLLALVIMGGIFLGGETAAQLDQLGPKLREARDQMVDVLRRYQWGRMLLYGDGLSALVPDKQDWMQRIGGIFSTTIGAIAGFFIVIFIGVYGAAAPHIYRDGLLQLVPRDARERASEVLDEVVDTLRNWLIGTFAKMVVVGVTVTIGLTLLGMPLALALGLIAFALEFAPYIGPILAAAPALLVALGTSPTQALYVLLLYLGVQALENYVVSPLIDQRSVKLPPALTISAQVLLGALLGALGVMFATPLTAMTVVLLRELYVQPDEPPDPPSPVGTP